MKIDTLQKNDLFNGFLETLESLKPTHLTPELANDFFWRLNTRSIIYVAKENDQVIGTATLLVEQKFIHKGGKVAHIEDVAVHRDQQGKGIGQQLIQKILTDAKQYGCYKAILNCDPSLISFYEKCGFQQSAVQMRVNL